MPASKNIATYTDCHAVLERAVSSNGVQLKFETKGKATYFSQRLNTYRNLLREANERNKPVGFSGTTPYDHFLIKAEGVQVTIKPRSIDALSIETLDGEPVDLPPVDAPASTFQTEDIEGDEDDLIEEAHDIAEAIRKGGGLSLE